MTQLPQTSSPTHAPVGDSQQTPVQAGTAPAGLAEPSLTERLRALRDALGSGLVERETSVRLALLAALAGEHLLLVGPPGTAKSLLARRLRLAFTDANYFERLLTRFTVPEELFGPLSIKALEADRYERLTASYLPTAAVAFLDEIFKANSAILNALLTLLNEREFDNGTRRERTPLIAVVGASNELPEGEELHALFDRFLLRLHVGQVSASGFPALLQLRGEAVIDVPAPLRLSPEDLSALGKRAEQVDVPDDVLALLAALRQWCHAEKIAVSDRRWRKVVKLLQVSALSNGRRQVSVWDCWLLQHCLWEKPEQRDALHAWYASQVGSSAAMDPAGLTRLVVAWEQRRRQDAESRSQMRNAKGEPLYMDEDGHPTPSASGRTQQHRHGEPLYLAPAGSRHGWKTLDDRTNGNAGFTQQELDEHVIVVVPKTGSVDFARWQGRSDYLTDRNNWLTESTARVPALEPTRHKAAYVEHCINDIRALELDVEHYRESVARHLDSLEREIRNHLWVTPDFVEPAARSLKETAVAVDALRSRLDAVRRGFELLPRDADQSPETLEGPVDA